MLVTDLIYLRLRLEGQVLEGADPKRVGCSWLRLIQRLLHELDLAKSVAEAGVHRMLDHGVMLRLVHGADEAPTRIDLILDGVVIVTTGTFVLHSLRYARKHLIMLLYLMLVQQVMQICRRWRGERLRGRSNGALLDPEALQVVLLVLRQIHLLLEQYLLRGLRRSHKLVLIL